MLLAAKNSGILFLIIWLEVGEDRHREKNLEFYIRKMKNLNQREKAKQGKEALWVSQPFSPACSQEEGDKSEKQVKLL